MIENEVSDGVIDPVVLRVYGTTEHVLRTVMQKRLLILHERFPRDLKNDPLDKSQHDVEETLLHILHELRQGIYVLIRRGHVRLMAVIANAEYEGRIKNLTFYVGDESVDMATYKLSKENLRKDVRKETWTDPNKWWASNGILCQVNRSFGWGTGMIKDLLYDLRIMCSKCHVEDQEFILNRRDIPMVRADGLHPYQFAGAEFGTAFKLKLPVFSLYTGDAFLDQPWLVPSASSMTTGNGTSWKGKKEVAFFRGSLTGWGTRTFNNTRLAVCSLDSPLVDARLVRLSPRDKVHNCEVRFDNLSEGMQLADPVPMDTWGDYKYLIYCHGHSAALRLYPMLGMGSVILYVEPSDPNYMCEANRLWFHDMLTFADVTTKNDGDLADGDNAHLVKVSKIEDLPHVVRTLKKNDAVVHRIAQNAQKLYDHLEQNRHEMVARRCLCASPP